MTEKTETPNKLPLYCTVVHPANNRVAARIIRGREGYAWSKEFDTAEQAAEFCDSANAEFGITKAQKEAMLCGSMFGWHVPGADPDTYK